MEIYFVTSGDISIVATMKRSVSMAEHLIKLKNRVTIIALDCKANRERIEYECPNAKIIYFNDSGPFGEKRQKKEIIKRNNPDLVYVSSISFRNWIHKFNTQTKDTRYIVEHSELTSMIKGFSYARRAVYRMFEFACNFIYDGQVVASRYLYNHFTKYMSSEKKRTVLYSPYAFNKNIYKFDKDKYKLLQVKYEKCKIVLYMGTLRENYGFFDLISAANILTQKGEKAKILFIGGGAHKNRGIEMVEKNKLREVVEFLGYVKEEDLGLYFKLADVFVSPLYDTVQDWARCPGKLFMYYAFNKPIVTCRVGEAIELLPDNEYFYESGDDSDMANKITKGLNSSVNYSTDEIKNQEWRSRVGSLNDWLLREVV